MHIMPRERFAQAIVAFLTLPMKRRFYYDPADGKVRAFMGHSKSKKVGGRGLPPDTTEWTTDTVDKMMDKGIELLHNTTTSHANSILEKGIMEMGREHIHWYQSDRPALQRRRKGDKHDLVIISTNLTAIKLFLERDQVQI